MYETFTISRRQIFELKLDMRKDMVIDKSSDDAHCLAAGLVFRGDRRPPEVIFKEGFSIKDEYKIRSSQPSYQEKIDTLFGCLGMTDGYGISTTRNIEIAALYASKIRGLIDPSEPEGYVYFIDARLGQLGYGIFLPKTHQHEINFLGTIPETHVIGYIDAVNNDDYKNRYKTCTNVTGYFTLVVNQNYLSSITSLLHDYLL